MLLRWCKEKNRSLLKGILYYLFPFFYLYLTLPDDYKSRRPRAVLAKILTIVITLEAILGSPIAVKAESNQFVTNCPICDSSEQIVYRFCLYNYDANKAEIYDFHYGITSLNCEIVHLVDTSEDFGFRFESDGGDSVCCFDGIRTYAFLDYSNIKYNYYDSYVSNFCDFDSTTGVYVVTLDRYFDVYDNSVELYQNGLINTFTNEVECYYPLLPNGEVQVLTAGNYQIVQDDAIKRLPKGADTFISSKTSRNYTITNDENVSIISNQQSNYLQDKTKWNTLDTVDVVAGILAGSATVVGLDIGVDLVLSAVTAINPILGATLFGCIVIFGATAGYSIGASLGSKIFTGYVSKDVSQNEKEIARKELKKELITDTATLAVSSAAVHYFKPKVYNSVDNLFIPKIKPSAELVNHLETGKIDGGVISGCHNENKFVKLCEQNGIVYEQVDAKLPNGMKRYQYSIPRKDGTLRTIRYKTVYDDCIMTLDDYLEYGTDVINTGISSKKWTKLQEGKSVFEDDYGINWQVYIRNGEVKTLYPGD